MYYFYILQNQKKALYYGYTSDLKRRLAEHQTGKSRTTSRGDQWALIYYEAYLSKEDAKEREIQVKQYGQALAQLKRRSRRSMSKS